MSTDPAFWRGKRVFLTGHTGFKGSWAAYWLTSMGAEVTGFALAPNSDPAMFQLIDAGVRSVIGDLADQSAVANACAQAEPEIILHLAAQPLVRYSYAHPVETFGTNLMGTVHLLQSVPASARVVLVITTDKVYENDERGLAFAEDAPLGGHDPYAASKACAEIAVQSYRKSFFADGGARLATARGGNVIGGGDFAPDRLVPDIVRAARSGQMLELRHPKATRPWQHVLDCLDGYFTYAQALWQGSAPDSLNIGPHDPADTMTVADVANAMARALGTSEEWRRDKADTPHEMTALALDPSRARRALGWQGRLSSADAIRLTADWYGAWANGADMTRVTRDQIAAYQPNEMVEKITR